MSDSNVGQRNDPDKQPQSKAQKPTPRKRKRASDVGRALRSVYDDTLREDVPDDFLNLLGKLS